MRTSAIDTGFRPAIISIGIFLVFASSMAALAGTILIWPGTPLDRLWQLNKTAHAELRKAGTYLGPLFWALGILLIEPPQAGSGSACGHFA